jgi:hypothetical protein
MRGSISRSAIAPKRTSRRRLLRAACSRQRLPSCRAALLRALCRVPAWLYSCSVAVSLNMGGVLLLLLLLPSLLLATSNQAAAATVLDLGGKWTVTTTNSSAMPWIPAAGKERQLPATVPGQIHTDLLAAGVISEPFYGDGDADLAWVALSDWVYTRAFEVPATLLQHAHVQLVSLGIDTVADIYINERHVFFTDNMFHRIRLDVKRHLKAGSNSIRVHFYSKPLEADRRAMSCDNATAIICPAGTKNPVQHPFNNVNYLRTEPCSFSWDWGPAYAPVGLWRPIYLQVRQCLRPNPQPADKHARLPDKNARRNCVSGVRHGRRTRYHRGHHPASSPSGRAASWQRRRGEGGAAAGPPSGGRAAASSLGQALPSRRCRRFRCLRPIRSGGDRASVPADGPRARHHHVGRAAAGVFGCWCNRRPAHITHHRRDTEHIWASVRLDQHQSPHGTSVEFAGSPFVTGILSMPQLFLSENDAASCGGCAQVASVNAVVGGTATGKEVVVPLQIKDVKADQWMPNGFGSQPLYTASAKFVPDSEASEESPFEVPYPLEDNALKGSAGNLSVRFGFRKVELVQNKLPGGKSYFFAVNGVPIPVKGSNWIPADAFESRVSRNTPNTTRLAPLFLALKTSHQNMIRNW